MQQVPVPLDPEIWLVDIDAATEALEAIEETTPRLGPDTLERIAEISDAAVQGKRRAAHIALRILIERAFGPKWRRRPFTYHRAGKPMLAHTGHAISLSHSGGKALIGVALGGPLGVDLEARRSLLLSPERREGILTAARTLAPDAPISSVSDEALLQAWVRLEAYAKATATGIGDTLDRSFVSQGRRRGQGLSNAGTSAVLDVSSTRIYDLSVGEGYYAAAAVPPASPAPEAQDFPATIEAIGMLVGG